MNHSDSVVECTMLILAGSTAAYGGMVVSEMYGSSDISMILIMLGSAFFGLGFGFIRGEI